MVPKTEIDGPGNAVSAGPACVPADLSTNPRHIAAIPTGITRPPHRTKRSPTPTHIARRDGQRQRASPDASGSKHGDCGKNRSERWGCGDFVLCAAHAAAAAPLWDVQHLEIGAKKNREQRAKLGGRNDRSERTDRSSTMRLRCGNHTFELHLAPELESLRRPVTRGRDNSVRAESGQAATQLNVESSRGQNSFSSESIENGPRLRTVANLIAIRRNIHSTGSPS